MSINRYFYDFKDGEEKIVGMDIPPPSFVNNVYKDSFYYTVVNNGNGAISFGHAYNEQHGYSSSINDEIPLDQGHTFGAFYKRGTDSSISFKLTDNNLSGENNYVTIYLSSSFEENQIVRAAMENTNKSPEVVEYYVENYYPIADQNSNKSWDIKPLSETELHLSKLGVSIEQAKEFILTNLDSLDLIFEICKDLAITTDMIAEIISIEGVDGVGVANYFEVRGFNSSEIGGSPSTIEDNIVPEVVDIVKDGIYQGTFSSILSTASFSMTINDDSISSEVYDPYWNETIYINGSVNNNNGEVYGRGYDEDGTLVTITGSIQNDIFNGTGTASGYPSSTLYAELA